MLKKLFGMGFIFSILSALFNFHKKEEEKHRFDSIVKIIAVCGAIFGVLALCRRCKDDKKHHLL